MAVHSSQLWKQYLKQKKIKTEFFFKISNNKIKNAVYKWAKDLNRYLNREDMQIAGKYIEIDSHFMSLETC